jgi:hypothetical protein
VRSWVTLQRGADLFEVGAGGVIGRMAGAALRLRDARVSEAHALVSLRGRTLKLLALRRWFTVDGERASEVELQAGQRLALAPGVELDVLEVHVADVTLGLDGLAGGPVELQAPVYGLVEGPEGLRAEATWRPDAVAHVASTASGWCLELDGEVHELQEGQRFTVGSTEVVVVPLSRGPARSTVEGFAAPLQVVLRHDTVHVHRQGRPPVVVSGVPARILSEVALLGSPAPWHVPAGEVWRDEPQRHVLRTNWDRNLRNLRRHLRTGGVRTDLVRPDGRGNVELFLLPDDTVVDET